MFHLILYPYVPSFDRQMLLQAWFRELPQGVLDPLAPEQVMQCQSEEEYVQLVKLLPPTEAALLDWAINLMADVVQEENHNKMNARNVAMVFAPNMTHVSRCLIKQLHVNYIDVCCTDVDSVKFSDS